LKAQILAKRHPYLRRREVQVHQTVQLVGVLILKTGDSECQVYTLGEVRLCQLLCANWPLSRDVIYENSAGLDGSTWGQGIQYRCMGGAGKVGEATSGCEAFALP